MVKIDQPKDNQFFAPGNNKITKALKYEHHEIKNLTAKDPEAKDVDAIFREFFEIPPAPPAPLVSERVKIHPKSTDLTDEITKTYASRKVVDIKKIEKLDTEATEKRLAVARSEYIEEKATALASQKGPENKRIKETYIPHQKTNNPQRHNVKTSKKAKDASKTATKAKESTEKKGAATSSLAAFLQQASEEKKERDRLNQQLESKKETIEDDQKKIDKRFDNETHRKE